MADLIDYLEAAVIAEIASQQNQVNTTYLSWADSVIQLFGLAQVKTTIHPFEKVQQRLVESGIIRTVSDDVTGAFYKIDTGRAVKMVNDHHGKDDSLIHKYRLIGRPYLETAVDKLWQQPVPIQLENIPDVETASSMQLAVPASDRIVQLGDNQARDDIIGQLDELEVAVRESNDADNVLGESRDRIVTEIRAGKELLKAPSVRIRAVAAVLVTALTFIASEFAGGIIGELAVQLLDALKIMLGI